MQIGWVERESEGTHTFFGRAALIWRQAKGDTKEHNEQARLNWMSRRVGAQVSAERCCVLLCVVVRVVLCCVVLCCVVLCCVVLCCVAGLALQGLRKILRDSAAAVCASARREPKSVEFARHERAGVSQLFGQFKEILCPPTSLTPSPPMSNRGAYQFVPRKPCDHPGNG